MNKKICLIILTVLILSPIFLLATPKPAHANILTDLVNGIKNVFAPSKPQQDIILTDTITIAPNGNSNKTGQITAGDILRFTYIITNTTGNTYTLTTLQTHIHSNNLNSFHNVQGTVNLNTSNSTVTIPYLTLHPHQQLTISFDVNTDFNKNTDVTVSTDPVLVDQQNKILATGQKQEVIVKKMNTDTFNMFVHISR